MAGDTADERRGIGPQTSGGGAMGGSGRTPGNMNVPGGGENTEPLGPIDNRNARHFAEINSPWTRTGGQHPYGRKP